MIPSGLYRLCSESLGSEARRTPHAARMSAATSPRSSPRASGGSAPSRCTEYSHGTFCCAPAPQPD